MIETISSGSVKPTSQVIVLAFPEVSASAGTTWYLKPLNWIGLTKNGMLQFGHNALAIVNTEHNSIDLVHFSRYGAPSGRGKARTSATNPELSIDRQIEFYSNGKIVGLEELLMRLFKQPLGIPIYGVMYAAILNNVNHLKLRRYIDHVVELETASYGAFAPNNLTCSRFVFQAIRAGLSGWSRRLLHLILNIPVASPMANILFLSDKSQIFVVSDESVTPYLGNRIRDLFRFFFSPIRRVPKPVRRKVRPNPNCKWLGTIFEGMWLELQPVSVDDGYYRIIGYSADSRLSYSEIFRVTDKSFDHTLNYSFDYICDALRCNAVQNGKHYRFVKRFDGIF